MNFLFFSERIAYIYLPFPLSLKPMIHLKMFNFEKLLFMKNITGGKGECGITEDRIIKNYFDKCKIQNSKKK